ncbi:MAG: beta-hexosaminidase, partial [Maricaulaceae bacterium]
LDMKALSGSLKSRTENALSAGCDIALQCSGDMASMEEVASGAKNLSGMALARAEITDLCTERVGAFDRQRADLEYRELLSRAIEGLA